MITGDVSASKRTRILAQFASQSEFRVLLASMKCGGTGLNVTAANHVVVADPWWHAEQEKQAWGRCFRRGQTKHVHVTRLITQDTIEDRVQEMQKAKSAVINGIVDPDYRLTSTDLFLITTGDALDPRLGLWDDEKTRPPPAHVGDEETSLPPLPSRRITSPSLTPPLALRNLSTPTTTKDEKKQIVSSSSSSFSTSAASRPFSSASSSASASTPAASRPFSSASSSSGTSVSREEIAAVRAAAAAGSTRGVLSKLRSAWMAKGLRHPRLA